MKTISRIKNIIPTVVGYARHVSKMFGHWYQNGKMHAKHLVALGLGSVFRYSDIELPDELKNRHLLKAPGYKSEPDHSAFSKVRTEVGEETVGKVAELIIQELYKLRSISLMAIDSTYIPYYFRDDPYAAWGHATLTKKEREFLGEKAAKGLKKGYKLHVIYDVETGIPLYWIVFLRMSTTRTRSRHCSTM